MKIESVKLLKALKNVTPAVSKEGILFMQLNVSVKRVMIQASDGVCIGNSIVDCVEVTEEVTEANKAITFYVGYTALNTAIVELGKYPTDDSCVEITVGNQLSVSRGGNKIELPLYTKEHYKSMQELPKDDAAIECSVNAFQFKRAIASTCRRVEINPKMHSTKSTVYIRLLKNSYEVGGSDSMTMGIVSQCGYGVPNEKQPNKPIAPELPECGYIDVAITGYRAKSILPVLDEDGDDIVLHIHKDRILLNLGRTILVVPRAEGDNTWTYHEQWAGLIKQASEDGVTYEVDRKKLLSAIGIIGCNISKSDYSNMIVVFKYEKDNLVVENVFGSASAKVEATIDGSFDGRYQYSIGLVCDILNGFEGERVLITIGEDLIHFEEATEQVVLGCMDRSRKNN